ncbi:GTPase HflX [Aliikangiella marina]|uniref:GTPase HflX n=1 Tax=Aliikangiella marina TaxID=1712262 RepID=A0A545T775_9GAMM|nr:ribosome rescue GTPase HflX [Aliikangiella marina]TQV73025.1 GTPase HflX [Aliikangiella marina]
MFERHSGGENAILVHIEFPDTHNKEDKDEFVDLAVSAGLQIKDIVGGSRSTPHPRYFIGTGKADEIAQIVKDKSADVVLFNHRLSPAQERNLERLVECRVIDRTGLILDIFAQRAHTHEGKLQVELAQLNHLSTRLVRGWTHLERQKGGIGLRGPGETQLETDRRLLRDRIKNIRKRLDKVEKQREQSRRSRKRGSIPTVALVGYTNAGKSTLFNRITESDVYAADQLFATLDPTHRKISLVPGQEIILSDTVGFIRHLPHDLVAAFKATLQESRQADILLHLIDASDERRDDNIEQVYDVLEQIGARNIKTIEVFNKIDRIEQLGAKVEPGVDGSADRVWCSAQTGEGMDLLRQTISHQLDIQWQHLKLKLLPQDLGIRSELYNLNVIESETVSDDASISLEININQADWRRLCRQTEGRIEAMVIDSAE